MLLALVRQALDYENAGATRSGFRWLPPAATPAASHTYPEMAAAGLWTTPTDLARFAIELWRSYHGRSDALLPQAMARRMLTRESGEFGLGLSLPRQGVPRFQHGGGNVGYRCFLVLSIESGDGIVIMTNGDSGRALMDEVLAAIRAAYGWRV